MAITSVHVLTSDIGQTVTTGSGPGHQVCVRANRPTHEDHSSYLVVTVPAAADVYLIV